MSKCLLFLRALSPLHCGTGASSGGIDLPIARDRPTGVPIIPGSTIKGVLRARAEDHIDPFPAEIFGSPADQPDTSAGNVAFGDGRLVFLPIRSLKGTFAYCTSPFLLEGLRRDAAAAGLALPGVTPPTGDRQARLSSDRLVLEGQVYLEDLALTHAQDEQLAELGAKLAALIFESDQEADFFQKRICLLADDVMALLLETATEIRTRIRLDEDTKTVQRGALWTEEMLPVESIACALLVGCGPRIDGDPMETLRNILGDDLIQIGGNASVGYGLCRARIGGGQFQ